MLKFKDEEKKSVKPSNGSCFTDFLNKKKKIYAKNIISFLGETTFHHLTSRTSPHACHYLVHRGLRSTAFATGFHKCL